MTNAQLTLLIANMFLMTGALAKSKEDATVIVLISVFWFASSAINAILGK